MMGLFSEVILQPALPQSKLDLFKSQARDCQVSWCSASCSSWPSMGPQQQMAAWITLVDGLRPLQASVELVFTRLAQSALYKLGLRLATLWGGPGEHHCPRSIAQTRNTQLPVQAPFLLQHMQNNCRALTRHPRAYRPYPPLPVQVLNLLQHLNDSSGAIPRRELAKLIYGRDSVFSRTPSPAQIRSLARDDVVAYLSTWERPDAAVFGISGQLLLPSRLSVSLQGSSEAASFPARLCCCLLPLHQLLVMIQLFLITSKQPLLLQGCCCCLAPTASPAAFACIFRCCFCFCLAQGCRPGYKAAFLSAFLGTQKSQEGCWRPYLGGAHSVAPAGDFDKREMKTLIEQRFGRWQPAPGQPAQPPAIPNTPLPQQGTASELVSAAKLVQTEVQQ